MASFAPEVPIRVDPETGVWTTDGLPMIYLPRHFFLNHLDAFRAALGQDAYARILYDAGYKSAWQWCEKESAKHGLKGGEVFLHYMKRLSQRGWGKFTVLEFDRTAAHAQIRLDHSVFVAHHTGSPQPSLCYGFSGWFVGALEWAGRDLGQDWSLAAAETQCAGDGKHDHCIFSVRPGNR